jgi:radical SAM superfamily enzyme YgiQ (UPF0313 family)
MQIKELNAIKKNWTKDNIKIGLIYPNTYRVAMTSLGVQLLYFLFNEDEDIVCERIFKPLDPRIAPYSLESQKNLRDFDVLAISCQFEHDYIQAIDLLLRGGINPDVRQRKESDPLVILGGPSITANPFPVLFTGDAFFLGDIEPIYQEFILSLKSKDKKKRIEALISVPGIIAYSHHFSDKGKWIGEKVESVKLKDISNSFYPIKQIIPEGVKGTKNEPIFGKAYYLETDRGCSERCKFCFVGHCRFPRTSRSLDSLIEIIDQAGEVNEFEKIVLYGSAIAQSGILDELIEYIIDKGYEVSCSSFRADYLSEKLLESLKKGKQRTLALAPETGDESLRLALNKRMDNETIYSALKQAWDTGFRQIKLYMIYGFPCEGEETRIETKNFISTLRQNYFPTGRIGISMNQFITKAHTPFQFAPMIGVKESKDEQKWYKSNLYQTKNIDLSLYAPEWSIIQRVLSLRSHEYFPVICQISKGKNTVGSWKLALKEFDSNLDKEAKWKYELDQPLPWDNIVHTLEKKTLISSYTKYLETMECK